MESYSENWARVGTGKRSGVLAPLFSVYSRKSLGVGDLADLKLLIDWCARTGNSILQLLPINEVGPSFCPYESISSFALEPMYAAITPVTEAQRNGFPPAACGNDKKGECGNSGIKRVDYRVKAEKVALLRERYLAGTNPVPTEAWEFQAQNSWWLDDFCLFKTLKANLENKPWWEWPDVYRERDTASIRSFRAGHKTGLDFEAWLQWLLYQQFQEVKHYAAEKKVLLMGDLPVLINRDSADVWAHPEFFKLDAAAGAPPDMFSDQGQRWGNPGMPTYNWEAIASDGYRYLEEKLRYAGEFYDLLRIDHIIGLFRIWSIPLREPPENEGKNGFFDPPEENKWEEHGRKILSVMLENTKMLLCGEDLGVIPNVCPTVMESLKIPGTDVQRWARDWNGTRDFLPPEKYRLLSVAALSTHDTTNWNAWWETESTREEKEKFWKFLEISGPVREKADPETTRAALKFILKTRSVFAVQSIFDWLNLAAGTKSILRGDQARFRINKPGTVSAENWSLVLPVPLEDLLEDEICGTIKTLITGTGR